MRSVRHSVAMMMMLCCAVPSATAEHSFFSVKVLSAESYEFKGSPIDPPDCNSYEISAYCFGSAPVTYVENTMVVEGPDGKSLKIACTVYSPDSNCVSLPVNQTFKAQTMKRGVEIRYRDRKGKLRKELYQIVDQTNQ